MQLDQKGADFSCGLHLARYDYPGDEPLIQRGGGDGVRFSLVHHAGIRHVFARTTLREEPASESATAQALEVIPDALDHAGLKARVVRQSLFTTNPTVMAFLERMRERAAEPALTEVFPQQPVDGGALAIEIWGVADGREAPRVEQPAAGLVTVQQDGLTTLHAAHRASEIPGSGVYPQTVAGFEALERLLVGQRVGFDRVARTWLYLGDITGPDGDTQRYKELNRGRSDFFATRTLSKNSCPIATSELVYPASTGIGAEGRDLTLGCLAMAGNRDGLRMIPLENPRQTAAHDYGPIYSPQSPKFSRAMAVEVGSDVMVLVSGTASITRSETRHLGDSAAQTTETLANIEALISQANLARHGLPGFGCSLADLAVARVYIKREADYAAVRSVCESRLGQVPTTYTLADVCRPQLLVEIEGIAFSRWGLPPS